MPGKSRGSRPQRRFTGVAKEDMEMVGVTVEDAGDRGRSRQNKKDVLFTTDRRSMCP